VAKGAVESFYLGREEMEEYAFKLGVGIKELETALGAKKSGRGRYNVPINGALSFLMSEIAELAFRVRRLENGGGGDLNLSEFEEAVKWAIRQAAGRTGYAPLIAVKNLVTTKLRISEGRFVELLHILLKERRGKYILSRGGDYKIAIGGEQYGFIKAL